MFLPKLRRKGNLVVDVTVTEKGRDVLNVLRIKQSEGFAFSWDGFNPWGNKEAGKKATV